MKRTASTRISVLLAAVIALPVTAGDLTGSEQPQVPQQYAQASGLPTDDGAGQTAGAPPEPVVWTAIPRGVLGLALNRPIVVLPLPLDNPWLEPGAGCGDGGILPECPD